LGSRAKYLLVGSALDVSVIVPTWNEQKYISKCLHSLRNQARIKPLEVIVVDGGSTDGTVEIAKEYADKVLVEPDKLVGAARNIGAKHALGDLLAFIDADTVVATDWVEAIQNGFKDHGAIGVTGPTLPYNGNVLDTITYRLWTIYLQRILLSARMPHVIGFNCAYKKDLFLQAGGFDETSVMSEDIRLAVKMRRFGRIKFEKEMSALTSPRRFQKFGHAYIAGLYLFNGFSTLLLNRSSRTYPPVR
jgi:glycosyltransferase involved in cell wall biosynthesis